MILNQYGGDQGLMGVLLASGHNATPDIDGSFRRLTEMNHRHHDDKLWRQGNDFKRRNCFF